MIIRQYEKPYVPKYANYDYTKDGYIGEIWITPCEPYESVVKGE